jgi:hypothetical protein
MYNAVDLCSSGQTFKKGGKRESTFLSNAQRFPKEHFSLDGTQASPFCLSGKNNI